MDAATKRRLCEGAAQLGVELDEPLVGRFGRLLDLLLEWNRKINLTAITEPHDVVERHFLDSLALVRLLGSAETLVDVGSGAGFPGAVLALVRPALRVISVESIRKKVAFQQTIRIQLAPNFEAICSRVEDVIAQGRRFDVAVSRATFDPDDWVALGSALVAPCGLLVAMRTEEQRAPTAPAGFLEEAVIEYRVAEARRFLHAFRRA